MRIGTNFTAQTDFAAQPQSAAAPAETQRPQATPIADGVEPAYSDGKGGGGGSAPKGPTKVDYKCPADTVATTRTEGNRATIVCTKPEPPAPPQEGDGDPKPPSGKAPILD